jgi:hypothetical protein
LKSARCSLLLSLFLGVSGTVGATSIVYFGSPTSVGCNSVDGGVTASCAAPPSPNGAAAANVLTPSIDTTSSGTAGGFGLYIASNYQEFAAGTNGGVSYNAAPLGAFIDGVHDSSSADGAASAAPSGCNTAATKNQHCETFTFTASGNMTNAIPTGSTINFSWNNITLQLLSNGSIGAALDQFWVEYVITSGSTSIDYVSVGSSNALTFPISGAGTTGATPTTEASLSGSGSFVTTSAFGSTYTISEIIHAGWVQETGGVSPSPPAGQQGHGIDLAISVGQGSLDLGVTTATPEPGTLALGGTALALLGILRRRNRGR